MFDKVVRSATRMAGLPNVLHERADLSSGLARPQFACDQTCAIELKTDISVEPLSAVSTILG